MKKLLLFTVHFCLLTIFGPSLLSGNSQSGTVEIWRNLMVEQSDSVSWVSITVRIEVSAGGRSFPPSERKLEALGTVLAPDGLTVLSLNKVDPTDSILSRMRGPADINVNYTEVLILRADGSEIKADFVLKDEDLDLAFIRPQLEQPGENDLPVFKCIDYNASNTLPWKFSMKWFLWVDLGETSIANPLFNVVGLTQLLINPGIILWWKM